MTGGAEEAQDVHPSCRLYSQVPGSADASEGKGLEECERGSLMDV